MGPRLGFATKQFIQRPDSRDPPVCELRDGDSCSRRTGVLGESCQLISVYTLQAPLPSRDKEQDPGPECRVQRVAKAGVGNAGTPTT